MDKTKWAERYAKMEGMTDEQLERLKQAKHSAAMIVAVLLAAIAFGMWISS